MTDLSTLTDQERALLAQYLAVKAGSPALAPALMQMVFDRLASGTFGSTLIEVIADLLPEGIPLGTDFSAYLPLVQGQGQPAAPPVAPPVYAGGQGGGGESSVGEPFDWSSFGARAPSKPLLPSAPAAAAPTPAPAVAPAPPASQPAQTDDTGLFGFEMSPLIPPQADPGYLKGPNPLFPEVPRPDPRVASLAAPAQAKPGPFVEPKVETKPPPGRYDPPTLPPLDTAYLPDGYSVGTPDPNEPRLAPSSPFPPAATGVDPYPFRHLSPGTAAPGAGLTVEQRDAIRALPSAPTPLRTAVVQSVSVNPQTDQPVDFGALLDAALSRDLTGPMTDDADRGIALLSALAPAVGPAAQSAPLSAPGAGVSPQQRDAIRALPPDPFDITIPPPAPKPALDEWVLRDWIEQRGLDQMPNDGFRTQSLPPQSSTKSLESSTDRVAANTTYAPVPAPLPLARMAVASILPEGTVIHISDDDRERIARAVATEVDPRLARMDPAAYQEQVYGVIDTILNRVASPDFPDTVVDVLNQPRQFSAITGPRRTNRERYGEVDAIPADRADPELRRMVEAWIGEREQGAPSRVGGHLHYANPNAADASNMNWITALDGPRLGDRYAVHQHGTASGFEPTEAVLAAEGLARNQSWLTTKPQTPISTTADLQADKLRAKNSIDFNLAVQAAAAEQSRVTQNNQIVTSPTGQPITVDQRNAFGGYSSPSSPGGPFTYPGQSVTSPTGQPLTVAQRNAFGGYTTPSSVGDAFTPAGRSTSGSQTVTAPTGGSITVAQRNAIGGYTAPTGRSTSGSQTVTSSSGRNITVSQRNAFGGY